MQTKHIFNPNFFSGVIGENEQLKQFDQYLKAHPTDNLLQYIATIKKALLLITTAENMQPLCTLIEDKISKATNPIKISILKRIQYVLVRNKSELKLWQGREHFTNWLNTDVRRLVEKARSNPSEYTEAYIKTVMNKNLDEHCHTACFERDMLVRGLSVLHCGKTRVLILERHINSNRNRHNDATFYLFENDKQTNYIVDTNLTDTRQTYTVAVSVREDENKYRLIGGDYFYRDLENPHIMHGKLCRIINGVLDETLPQNPYGYRGRGIPIENRWFNIVDYVRLDANGNELPVDEKRIRESEDDDLKRASGKPAENITNSNTGEDMGKWVPLTNPRNED